MRAMQWMPYKVLLPEKVLESIHHVSAEEFKRRVIQYMAPRYPDYIVMKVKDGFAICERK